MTMNNRGVIPVAVLLVVGAVAVFMAGVKTHQAMIEETPACFAQLPPFAIAPEQPKVRSTIDKEYGVEVDGYVPIDLEPLK